MVLAFLADVPVVWLVVGFTGQAAFTLRFVVQWIVSEVRRESAVPVVFWWMSLVGSVLLLAYNAERGTPPFVVLFAVNLGIYLRNLTLLRRAARGASMKLVVPLILGTAIAVIVAAVAKLDWSEPPEWLVAGFVGQVVWSSRFVIQWVASERQGRSVMPEVFWWVSLVGDAILLPFAIHLGDPVMIVAFSFNSIVYIRNLVLIDRKRSRDATERS